MADKDIIPSFESGNNPGAMAAVGNLSSGRIANFIGRINYNCNDSTSPNHSIWILEGRSTPVGDALYAQAPIGSLYFRLRASGGAIVGADIFRKIGATSADWEPTIFQSESAQFVVTRTALADEAAAPTAAQLLGGEFTMTPGAARNFTLPSAADLLALMPNAKIGTSFRVKILNLAAATHAITVVASASITNGGRAGDLTIAYATTAEFEIRFTVITAGSEAAVAVRC